MERFVQRGGADGGPIEGLSPWLSAILRARGIDTPEKAERFLHPDISRLYDPKLMLNMQTAVDLLRGAIAKETPIVVYGDYDVDGICAASIMVETLREMGAHVTYRLPKRHSEGYGLNEKAVKEIAEEFQAYHANRRQEEDKREGLAERGEFGVLLTVDCGISNTKEVAQARAKGMTVIVTDHHQLPEELPKAHAALNPLMGEYPFRRLCGAGVALKITQALLGMDAVMRRVDLAAMATVADVVPLIDENRIIVRAGLEAISHSSRPGMQALLKASQLSGAVTSGRIAFQLAPRLNAGGRLEDASQGVELMLTDDPQRAEALAMHLEENNRNRQTIERNTIEEALKLLPVQNDFRDDRVLIVAGKGWNSGVIGLAAGKICERYHFPVIVLSVDDEKNEAVGSCRSIQGVNIFQALTSCGEIFERFGGHEMAAGLTIRTDRIPELRQKLNEFVNRCCDEACYTPYREYDMELPLEAVNRELIDSLQALQPTGFGNPAPMFLVRHADVQESRPVGAGRTHLKMLLSQGVQVRDGIGFGMGQIAQQTPGIVDAIFEPELNEYKGSVTAQLHLHAVKPAEGTVTVPPAKILFRALLQETERLLENNKTLPCGGADAELPSAKPVKACTEQKAASLLSGQGTLLIAHEREKAAAWQLKNQVDVTFGRRGDGPAYDTLLCGPVLQDLTDIWQRIILLDGDLFPGEADAIRSRCPRAELFALKPNGRLLEEIRRSLSSLDEMRGIYTSIRMKPPATFAQVAEMTGLTEQQVMLALCAFLEIGLIGLSLEPFQIRLIPGVKASPDNSRVIRYFRELIQQAQKGGSNELFQL